MEQRTENERERKEAPPEMTLEDWYRSKRYLRWPLIIMFLVVLLIVMLFHLNII